ncbi:response regulator with CheY-like receiver, AAA-type ATPase, and DNA-binding domains [secondary endosymbiont of Ctenarytaina eucalypti]|uniref:Response regulator with CheY-like receiver, AAA-type ATPase, and DNA-binding domains n=1 Tax=secondary endosymbiont of Ctenarytaina eucalypti TaxID=1199245 RepID=J3VRE4_9ENTR|nr:response regulator with CheY-like receiver, AAA-type ATPase, and DNA-binding domains [secondary endosymbiont of Ctenarytaina eucalypti]
MPLLVIEDNPFLRHHLTVQMREINHQVDAAETAQEADYFLNEHTPGIAIVDLGPPDEDGLDLIRRWRSHQVNTPLLLLTAHEG